MFCTAVSWGELKWRWLFCIAWILLVIFVSTSLPSSLPKLSLKQQNRLTKKLFFYSRNFQSLAISATLCMDCYILLVGKLLQSANFSWYVSSPFYTVNPLEGAYCGYQDNDGCYYRVRVMKFSQPLGLYFHHKEQARVRKWPYLTISGKLFPKLLGLPCENWFYDFHTVQFYSTDGPWPGAYSFQQQA